MGKKLAQNVIIIKANETIHRLLNLVKELKNLRNMKVPVITIIVLSIEQSLTTWKRGKLEKIETILIIVLVKIIFTNPSAQAGYDTRSIFKRSLTGLNSVFLLLD